MRFQPLLLLATIFWVSACDSGVRKQISDAPLISRTFIDGTGQEIILKGAPNRVTILAPNLTEMAFAIGADSSVVAVCEACDFPDAALKKQSITAWPEIDLELLKKTETDLVILPAQTYALEEIQKVDQNIAPVFQVKISSLSDVFEGILTLGRLFDRQDQAQALADSLARLEQRIADSTANEIAYGCALVLGTDPLRVAGGSGYFNDLIAKAGGKNVFGKSQEAVLAIEPQTLLAAYPEYLIIASANPSAYQDLLASAPALYNLPAAMTKQVFRIDPDLILRPGPRSLEGLIYLANALHTRITPDKFLDPPAESILE